MRLARVVTAQSRYRTQEIYARDLGPGDVIQEGDLWTDGHEFAPVVRIGAVVEGSGTYYRAILGVKEMAALRLLAECKDAQVATNARQELADLEAAT